VTHRPPLVSFLGRLTHQKGPRAFIDAAREVLSAAPHARFVMAGTGDLLSACQRMVVHYGMDRQFSFPGFLCRDAGAALLADSAAFVMPSVSEPFGIVALEAAAQGAPLVLSRRSGVAEIISSAVFVDPFDHHAIARAVCGLLADRVGAARQADRARHEATGMRWEMPAQQIADLYQIMAHEACLPVATTARTHALMSLEGLG
jgi:glycogen(starch) synthase